MTIPLTWHRSYDADPRQVARLGSIQVGAVMDRGAGAAEFIVWLPNAHGSGFAQWRKVKGGEEPAKVALTAYVLAWLKDAGVIDAAMKTQADAQSLPLFAETPA